MLTFFQHRRVTPVWIVVPSAIGVGVTALWILTPSISTQYGPLAAPHQSQILYAPLTNLETADQNLIGSAKSTLNVAAYSLTDSAIIETIIAAKQRGVVVVDHKTLDRLTALRGPWREL
jgi:hypothetical protein